MEEMEDINLDFLVSPPRQQQQLFRRPPTPIATNTMHNQFGNKKHNKKKLDIAQKIAKVDELVQENEKFKLDNNEIQQKLKDFQKTALEVQKLYSEEKHKHESAKKELTQLKKHYENVDTDLANKTMVYDQMKARLDDYEGRPINYDNLVVKYIRIMLKLEAEDSDVLRYSTDKVVVEELIQYCKQMKLKLPRIKSPKKPKSKSVKPKTADDFVQCSDEGVKPKTVDVFVQCSDEGVKPTTVDAFVQCSDEGEKPPIQKPAVKEQYTECKVERRDQASQYISTMITRQTNTEKIIQKHVSTMFPEPNPTPPINDILNAFCKWGNIQSITPLEDFLPIMQSEKILKTSTTSTGTCTMLCNIRRKIDYLPPITPGIKQELTTPSPSPIPNTNTGSVTNNAARLNNHQTQTSNIPTTMNNQNQILPNSILTLFNATSNSALGQLSSTAFNELWQIFGTMLLSLLQTSNAGIANINQNSINQQQFLDWLLELYMSSSTSRTQQTMSQQVNSTQTSPLHFNESSALTSSTILRPQAMKSLPTRHENDVASQSELSNENTSHMQQNSSTSPIPTSTVENFSQDSNSMDREIQYSTNALEIQTDICEPNVNQLSNTNETTTKSRKDKYKHKMIDQIQELLPEDKLNKKKRKALKRLLKDKKQKKKSSKNKKDKISVINETEDNHIETAVDFLKTFAQDHSEFQNNEFLFEQSVFGENRHSTHPTISEESSVQTENTQPLTKTLASSNNDDFTFIKPAVSQSYNFHHSTKSFDSNNSTFVKPAKKLKKSKISKTIENKYQMLFGDSDSEIESEEDMSKENYTNPVTNATEMNAKDFECGNNDHITRYTENCQYSQDVIRENCNKEIVNLTDQPSCSEEVFNDKSYYVSTDKQEFTVNNNLDQTCQEMNSEIDIDTSNQEQFSIPEIQTPLLKNLENNYFFENPVNVSTFSNINDILIDKIELETQNTVVQHIDAQPTSEEIDSTIAIENFPSDVDKDLELSSDNDTVEDEENCNYLKNEHIMSNTKNYTVDKELTQHSKTYQNEYYNYNSLPELQDGGSEYEIETKTYSNIILSKNYNTNVAIRSLPNLDHTEQDTPILYTHSKYNFRQNVAENSNVLRQTKNIKILQNIETDGPIKSQSGSINETYKSDFEKDFELSSDNESELTDVENQLKEEYHPAINKSYSSKNLTQSHQQTNNQDYTLKSVLKDTGYCQSNFTSDSLSESEENISQDVEQDSNDQSLLDQTDYVMQNNNNLKNNDHNYSLYSSSDSLTESEEISIPNIKQDFTDCEKSENAEENTTTERIEQDLKGFEHIQNGRDQHLQEMAKINQNPTSLNAVKLSTSSHKFEPLPDFTDTFIQHKKVSNSEIIQNVERSKISENDSESGTNSLCWSVITVADTTVSNDRLTSTSEDEEISIIEISSDKTGLNNIRDLASPIENDLIIDKDDKLSETDDINIEQSKESHLNHSDNSSADKSEYQNYSKSKPMELKTEIRSNTKTYREENENDSLNSSCISTILNSSLYNEVLTDSLRPIVNDLLEEDDVLKTPPLETKSKRGRKRKSECLPEVQPCKRSQRLKAKQMILEQSLNLTPIEIGKYTRSQNSSSNDIKSATVLEIKMRNTNQIKTNDGGKSNENITTNANNELKHNLPIVQMGFFKERIAEFETKPTTDKTATKSFKSCPSNGPFSIYKPIKQNKIDLHIITESNSNFEESNIAEISQDNEESYLERLVTKLETKADKAQTFNEAFSEYSDSPKSPPPTEINEDDLNKITINIPQERSLEYIPQQKNATLFDTLIYSYSTESRLNLLPDQPKVLKQQQQILSQLEREIKLYCCNEMELDPDHTALKLIYKILYITQDYNLIQKALMNIAQNAELLNIPEKDLPSIIQEMPPRHLGRCLQRLFFVLKHFLSKNHSFCKEIILQIESLLFNTQQTEQIYLEATLNLTQFYLMACKHQESLQIPKHPARLFIAKCLYYYKHKATLMVHEVLLWYPTVLPHREDTTYDRSDPLITVIQYLLMNTKYDMANQELRGKSLISKLRYEYHYEAYKPTFDEVIINLVEKLKNSKFYNISLSFGIMCKRLIPKNVEDHFLLVHLLPLAKEYYNQALITTGYDKRIAVLLEIISMIVKPFPVSTNVDVYLNEFSRYLNDFDRPVIQEAALCSILRLQRFGYANCFNLLRHFKPTSNLDNHTQAMLKTFLHRKQLQFWKTLKLQNPNNLN